MTAADVKQVLSFRPEGKERRVCPQPTNTCTQSQGHSNTQSQMFGTSKIGGQNPTGKPNDAVA